VPSFLQVDACGRFVSTICRLELVVDLGSGCFLLVGVGKKRGLQPPSSGCYRIQGVGASFQLVLIKPRVCSLFPFGVGKYNE
jgi:hypothetical protein